MVFWISKEDFGENQCRTYKIKCPGVYRLKENISFNPKKNKVAAISIESESVVLDLNGMILKQSSKNKQTQITGIVVKTGHNKVTILGNYGTVKNFSQRGIYVEGGNSIVTIGDETLLTVTGCGYGTPVALQDGLENILQGGIQLGEMVFFVKFGFGKYNGILNEIKVVNVISTQNNTGIGLGEGNNYTFTNCSFSSNLEYRLINEQIVTLGGFYVPKSVVCYGIVYFSNPELDTPELKSFGITDLVFNNCRFNSNMSDATREYEGKFPLGSYCDSLYIGTNTRGIKISQCQFNSNQSVLTDSGIFNITAGCVLSSGYGTVIENSEFSNNTGGKTSGLVVSGLIATSSTSRDNFQTQTISIKGCTVSNNIATTTATSRDFIQVEAIGINLLYPSGVTIKDCVIENNTSRLFENNKDVLNAFADGIFVFSDINFPCKFTNNVEISGCKISRNRVRYGKTGTSSGIRVYDDLCENIVIKNNTITENWRSIEDILLSNFDYEIQGAGVDLFNQQLIDCKKTGPSYVSVLDNVIKSNNDFGIYTNLDYTNIQNNNIQNHAVGIDIDATEGCEGELIPTCGSSVIGNTILQSSTSAINETNMPSASFFLNNIIYGTGLECNNYAQACIIESSRSVKKERKNINKMHEIKRKIVNKK